MERSNRQMQQPASWVWLLGALAVSMLAGSIPAKGAAVGSRCVPGEPMDLRNPVVTVVQGPGDPLEQRDWWEGLERAWVAGDVAVFLGEESFELEAAP
jgi:hypothetical protein